MYVKMKTIKKKKEKSKWINEDYTL